MQALLDTYTLLWWLADDPALTKAARKIIAEVRNTIFVSAASAWEIAMKMRLGKLPTAADLVADLWCAPDLVEVNRILISSIFHGILRNGL